MEDKIVTKHLINVEMIILLDIADILSIVSSCKGGI